MIARESGVRPQFNLRKNGTLKMINVGELRMPKVTAPKQDEIYDAAIEKLDNQVKHAMIMHPNVAICVNRTPTYNNRIVKTDRRGQALNGLMDISRTQDSRYPIWCPITFDWYRQYKKGNTDADLRHKLAMQIVNILGTLRMNILYDDGSNAMESGEQLVKCALPLLNMLVNGLTIRE
jgi:hypothetical protein